MPDEKYVFLEHPADAKFRAYGRTLAEAFANAALATASLMWDPAAIAPRIEVPVRVRGTDLEQLLVRFLEEIIYLFEARSFLLAAAEGVRIGTSGPDHELEAVFRGDARSAAYETHGGVKAVTYNEMKIQENGGCTVQVVVDV